MVDFNFILNRKDRTCLLSWLRSAERQPVSPYLKNCHWLFVIDPWSTFSEIFLIYILLEPFEHIESDSSIRFMQDFCHSHRYSFYVSKLKSLNYWEKPVSPGCTCDQSLASFFIKLTMGKEKEESLLIVALYALLKQLEVNIVGNGVGGEGLVVCRKRSSWLLNHQHLTRRGQAAGQKYVKKRQLVLA